MSQIKIALFVSGMFLSSNAFGAKAAPAGFLAPEGLSEIACSSAVRKLLEGTHATGPWTRQVDPAPKAFAYRSPTAKFGQWVEFHRYSDKTSTVFVVSDSAFVSHEWKDGKACKATTLKAPGLAVIPKDAQGQRHFTDKDLEKVLNSKKAGLIYVWSPGMVYSVKHFRDFQKVAKKMNLQFVALMDPDWDQGQARMVASTKGIPLEDRRVRSTELRMRNITTHYPTSIVYAHGRLAPRVIVGVYTPETLEPEIKTDLAFLTAFK